MLYRIPTVDPSLSPAIDVDAGADSQPAVDLTRVYGPAVDVAIVNDAVELFKWGSICPGIALFASLIGAVGAWLPNKWLIYLVRGFSSPRPLRGCCVSVAFGGACLSRR